LLDIADAKGNTVSAKKLHVDAVLDPHIAFGHGRVLLTISTRTGSELLSGNNRGLTQLVVHRFSVEGNEQGEPVILDQLGGWEFGNSLVVPIREGWLLLAEASLQGANYYFAHLAPDGSLVSGPELVNAGVAISFLDVVPYAGGAVSFDGKKINFLSADGFVTHTWQAASDEFMGLGGLVVHKGRLFVTYTTAPTQSRPVTNQVLIRELQCVP
jgi:hypothetical protein